MFKCNTLVLWGTFLARTKPSSCDARTSSTSFWLTVVQFNLSVYAFCTFTFLKLTGWNNKGSSKLQSVGVERSDYELSHLVYITLYNQQKITFHLCIIIYFKKLWNKQFWLIFITLKSIPGTNQYSAME